MDWDFLWAEIEIISHSFHHGDQPAGDARAVVLTIAPISRRRHHSSGSHQVNKQPVFIGLQGSSVLIRAPVSLYSIFQTNYFIKCRCVCSGWLDWTIIEMRLKYESHYTLLHPNTRQQTVLILPGGPGGQRLSLELQLWLLRPDILISQYFICGSEVGERCSKDKSSPTQDTHCNHWLSQGLQSYGIF